MDEETILLLVGGVLVAGFLLKKDLFSPKGTTKEGFSNLVARQNDVIIQPSSMTDRTFVTVGDTTFGIRDSDLPRTGFIRRRAAFGNLTGLDNFDWYNKWVYS